VHIQHVPFGEVATSMCTARLPVSRSAPAPADGGARAPGGGPPEPERGTAEYILVASYRVADGQVDGGLLTVMQIRPEPAARRRGRALAPAPVASVPPAGARGHASQQDAGRCAGSGAAAPVC